MRTILLTIFWSTALLPFMCYFGYPGILYLLGKIFPFNPVKKSIFPSVSLIIPAYNEEKNIAKKVENTLSLEYPSEKVEILVGSDGSTDQTAEIMGNLMSERVRFFDFKENRGKTAVQNDLVSHSHGDILIFTDAASFLHPKAIKKIVRNFADPRIGCVAGRMRFVNTDKTLTTQSQGLYWRYETKIRSMESKLGRLIGVDGPLYAVKRDFYIPLEHYIMSDFLTPLLVLKQAKKVIWEPEAIVDEDPTTRAHHEFATRRRIALRGFVALWTNRDLLNPFKYPGLASQISLHKLFRWLIGPAVLLNLAATVLLSTSVFFKFLLFIYTLFISAALAGYLLDHAKKKCRLLTLPYYFVLVNAAASMGFFDFLKKKQATKWVPVREPE